MSINLIDEYLERQIDAERQRRGDATKAKTAAALLRERLMQLEIDRGRSGDSGTYRAAANVVEAA